MPVPIPFDWWNDPSGSLAMDPRFEPPYVADKRLYLDKDGKVVQADDPNRLTLLVAEGNTLPGARARELGLVGATAPAPAGGGPSPRGAESPPGGAEDLHAAGTTDRPTTIAESPGARKGR